MVDCYCKNCNNIIGKWIYEQKYYNILEYCIYRESKNCKSIYFLDCENCNKFVGLLCRKVCENCFGEKEIFEKNKNLFNWFLKYKKILNSDNFCRICNKDNFRWQLWFFKELIFYK